MLAAALVAALCVAFSVTFRLFDTDLWQHLRVGQALWSMQADPRLNQWTWPGWGSHDVNYAWGFEALLWPFWRAGGVLGLFVWRWGAALLTFGALWAVARRMGARGFAPLVVLVVCALVYRQRSQVRPESLVALLLAVEIAVLEAWRRMPKPGARLRDPLVLLPIVMLVWANVHLSVMFGLAVIGIHLLAVSIGASARDPDRRDARRRLGIAALVSLGCALLNPFGVRILTLPIEYFTEWRHELVYRSIVELWPVTWSANLRNGLPLLVAGWPLLLVWRARREGFDLAEALLCAMFTTLGLTSSRLLGLYAVVAAPYLARDLSDVGRGWRWPAWSAAPARRALATACLCVALGIPEWSLPSPRSGVGFEPDIVPASACDFMAATGVRGRGFSPFEFGGYLIWRFWPDRSRLPFLDVHLAAGPEERRLYAEAFLGTEGWRAADARYHFDYVLLPAVPPAGTRLLDDLDEDSNFALVFADDAAALFVRRAGALAALADSAAYRVVPAGPEGLDRLAEAARADTTLRARVAAEFARRVAASPRHENVARAAAWFAALEGEEEKRR